MTEHQRLADTTAHPKFAMNRIRAREIANAYRVVLFPDDGDG